MDQYKTPPAGRRLTTLVLAAGDFGRPYVLPPNTPADRAEIIREAFQKTLSDEEALANAKKKKLEIDLTSSDELEKLSREVVSQPPEIVGQGETIIGKVDHLMVRAFLLLEIATAAGMSSICVLLCR